MNKKGQALALFIIIIPIILLLMGTLIEYSVIVYNKERATSVTKTIIKTNMGAKDEESIKELFKKNGIEENINVIAGDNLEIAYTLNVESFLGKLINKESYKINIDIIGHEENGKLEFKKGEYYD